LPTASACLKLSGMDRDEPSCCFDEWAGAKVEAARKREIVDRITRSLVEAVGPDRFEGRTVLDLGCGIGDLSLAALARGASRTTGLDLGPGAVEQARALARERGLAERSSFDVGDAADAELKPHDVVVLNRVFCCSPRVDDLLENSLAATRSVYAFTTLRSRGLVSFFLRIQAGLANVWYRLRETKFRGFRVFIHDVEAIDRRVREAGFRPVVEGRRRLTWHLAVYERA
jgi:predicted RNA methylase